jgi:CHASE2 domain-containing sensor protein/signal transduction histidine kinase
LLKNRLVLEWFVITGLTLSAVWAIAYWSLTSRIDHLLLDQAVPMAAPPASDDIILVMVDDQSLATVGKWPWPRTQHAQMISIISAASPRAIGYDILFTENAAPEEDAALAQAARQSGKLILPYTYQAPGLDGRAYDLINPIPELKGVTAATGHVALDFDDDGLVRRTALVRGAGSDRMVHFAQAIVFYVTKKPPPQDETISLIPFQPLGSFRQVGASKVLNGEVPSSFFRDKIVLVGASAQGLRDNYPVAGPLGAVMPGVEIQANIVNGLLADKFIRPVSETAQVFISVIIVLLLMLAFWVFRPAVNLIVSLVEVAALLLGAYALVFFAGLWFAPGAALIGILLAYPLWGWRRLTALSAFVDREAMALGASPSGNARSYGFDHVADHANQLRALIGQMKDARQFMAQVIEDAPDALCVSDENGRIQLVNEEGRMLFGDDLSGQNDARFAKADAPEITLPDGRSFIQTRSPMGDKGTIIRLADITSIRAAEKNRKETLEFLSHDMRAPQAAIINLINSVGNDKNAETLSRIKSHAENTLNLTDQFVQLARLESVDLQSEPILLADLVEETVDMFYGPAKTRRITLKAGNIDHSLFILGDAATLKRVFANLISNAIKYSPDGSTVDYSVNQARGKVCVNIIDHGPGIPAERLNGLYERFGARSDGTEPSVGLGLAFVKTALDKHNAAIFCTSSREYGTTFAIEFDLINEAD